MGSIKRTASDLGLPFGEISHIYNTRLAQELSCFAEKENKGAVTTAISNEDAANRMSRLMFFQWCKENGWVDRIMPTQ